MDNETTQLLRVIARALVFLADLSLAESKRGGPLGRSFDQMRNEIRVLDKMDRESPPIGSRRDEEDGS